MIVDESARVCFEVYKNHKLPKKAFYRIPLVQEYMPNVLLRKLRTVAQRLSEDDTAVEIPTKLPGISKGTATKGLHVRWNRCPTASIEYSGWIDVYGQNADIYLCLLEADLTAYRKALTAAAVLSDNSGDGFTFKVKVFSPNMYNAWEQCYEVKVCSGILRPLRLKGQTMWNVTDKKEFIAFDGSKGGWYIPFIK